MDDIWNVTIMYAILFRKIMQANGSFSILILQWCKFACCSTVESTDCSFRNS